MCFSCMRKFSSGIIMNHWVGIYEGDFNSIYCCLTCKEIMDDHYPDVYEGYPEGFVKELLLGDEYPEQLLRKLKQQ
jgi:hypothetical protein